MCVLAALALATLASVEVVDDVGRTLTLAAPPRRIISTAPSNTEVLFALGVGDRVVGVTRYCVDPPEARSRAQIGDFSSIDLERVVALAPDLVVATWLEQRRQVERMSELGLPVLVLFPATIDETMVSIQRLGRAVGKTEEAAALVAGMKTRLAAVDARVAGIAEGARPRVLVVLGTSPLYTAGPGSTVDEAIRRAGGRNLAHDLGQPYAVISSETVVARDPEIVIVGMATDGNDAAKAFAELPGFARLSAVRSGRVHGDLNPGLLFHHSQRLVDGIELLVELFHGRPAKAAP